MNFKLFIYTKHQTIKILPENPDDLKEILKSERFAFAKDSLFVFDNAIYSKTDSNQGLDFARQFATENTCTDFKLDTKSQRIDAVMQVLKDLQNMKDDMTSASADSLYVIYETGKFVLGDITHVSSIISSIQSDNQQLAEVGEKISGQPKSYILHEAETSQFKIIFNVHHLQQVKIINGFLRMIWTPNDELIALEKTLTVHNGEKQAFCDQLQSQELEQWPALLHALFTTKQVSTPSFTADFSWVIDQNQYASTLTGIIMDHDEKQKSFGSANSFGFGYNTIMTELRGTGAPTVTIQQRKQALAKYFTEFAFTARGDKQYEDTFKMRNSKI